MKTLFQRGFFKNDQVNLFAIYLLFLSPFFLYGCPAAVLIPALAAGGGTYAVGEYASGLHSFEVKGNGDAVYSACREVLIDELGFSVKSENKEKRIIETEGSGRKLKVTVEEVTPKLTKVNLASHKGIGGETELNGRIQGAVINKVEGIGAAISGKVEGENQTVPHLKE